MTYQDTDCLNESNMTDEEIEYYKGLLNKIFGVCKWEGLPKDLDSISFEKIISRYGRYGGARGGKI